MRILMGTDPGAATLVEHENAKLCLGAGFEDDVQYLHDQQFMEGDEDKDKIFEMQYQSLRPFNRPPSSSNSTDTLSPVQPFPHFGDYDSTTSKDKVFDKGYRPPRPLDCRTDNGSSQTSADGGPVDNFSNFGDDDSSRHPPSILDVDTDCLGFGSEHVDDVLSAACHMSDPTNDACIEDAFDQVVATAHGGGSPSCSSDEGDDKKSNGDDDEFNKKLAGIKGYHYGLHQPQKKPKVDNSPEKKQNQDFTVQSTHAKASVKMPGIESKFPYAPVQMAVVEGSDGGMYLQALFSLNDVVEFSGNAPAGTPPTVTEDKPKDDQPHLIPDALLAKEEKPVVSDNVIVKVRKYSNATSSRFCHVCARSSRGVPMAVCQNVMHGVCRKVICEKCCIHHQWNFVEPTPAAVAGTEKSGFVCAHCKGLCPERAQCNTYKRTNQRRRAKGAEKRKAIEVAMANGEDVGAILKEQGD